MANGRTRDLDGMLVALVGGSGFFGRHLAQELLARGARLRVCSRRPERAFRLKPLGGLGQTQFVAADVTRPETVARALVGADAVVNLVGAFAGNLDAVQGAGIGRVAQAAKDAGARAFVHVSALGADAASDVAYARTKAEGEAAVLAAFPAATVVRPSILFGEDDGFLNMFGGLMARLPVLPVFGAQAKLQPVNVDDAAEAVANALANPGLHGGKTYELAGPEVVTMGELNRRIAKAADRSPVLVELPDGVCAAFAALTGWLPGAPMSMDQWKLLKAGNFATGTLPGIDALGVVPRPLGLFLDRWMTRYRKFGRFGVKAKTAG
ncbi:MAG: complex I NDUFA9 subunit family protein [Novosphingobium sp.]